MAQSSLAFPEAFSRSDAGKEDTRRHHGRHHSRAGECLCMGRGVKGRGQGGGGEGGGKPSEGEEAPQDGAGGEVGKGDGHAEAEQGKGDASMAPTKEE